MTGAGPLAVKGAEGPTWVLAAPVTIPQGATSTVVIRFQMPGRPRIDDPGALGPDPNRAVDLGRHVVRRRRPGHDLVVTGGPGQGAGGPTSRALRVLRISKSGVVTAWRERERLLRSKGADLTLVTAVRWEEGGSMVPFTADGDTFAVPVRTVGRHPNLFVYDPTGAVAVARLVAVGPHRPARGAVRPGRGRGAGAVPDPVAPHPVRGVVGPEHRQALPAAVPVVRALVPPAGGRCLHLQCGGRRDPPAEGPRRGAGAAAARRRRRAVPAPGPRRAGGAAAHRVRGPSDPPQGGGRAARGGGR